MIIINLVVLPITVLTQFSTVDQFYIISLAYRHCLKLLIYAYFKIIKIENHEIISNLQVVPAQSQPIGSFRDLEI